MEQQLADILPIMAVEQDAILSKQGDLTIAFRVELSEVFTLSDEDYENLHQSLVKAVRLLEPGTVLHKQDWFFSDRYQHNDTAGQSWLDQGAGRHFSGRSYLNHESYVYLTRKPARRRVATSLLSSLLQRSIVPPETLDAQFMAHFAAVAGRFQRLLEDSKLVRLTRLKDNELLSSTGRAGLIERYCSLSDGKRRELKDITFEPNLQIGADQLAIYSLADAHDLPAVCGARIDHDRYSTDKTKFPVSFAAHLGLFLPCDHIYNQFLVIGDAQATLKEMEKKRLRLQSLSAYSRANAIAQEATHQFLNAVANIFGAIIAKIQENMIIAAQSGNQPGNWVGNESTGYLIFLLIGIVGYFTVPSIAGYIMNVGGHALFNRASSVFSSAASFTSGLITQSFISKPPQRAADTPQASKLSGNKY